MRFIGMLQQKDILFDLELDLVQAPSFFHFDGKVWEVYNDCFSIEKQVMYVFVKAKEKS